MSGNKKKKRATRTLSEEDMRVAQDATYIRYMLVESADHEDAAKLCDRMLAIIGEQSHAGSTIVFAVANALAAVAVEAAQTEFTGAPLGAEEQTQVLAAKALCVATAQLAMETALHHIRKRAPEAQQDQEALEQQEQLFRETMIEEDE